MVILLFLELFCQAPLMLEEEKVIGDGEWPESAHQVPVSFMVYPKGSWKLELYSSTYLYFFFF